MRLKIIVYVFLSLFSRESERVGSERVGFEPTVPLEGVRVLSRDVPSATQPSFQEQDGPEFTRVGFSLQRI